MAEEGNTQNTTVNDTQNQDATVIEENLNLDAKVTVKNLAGWDVTFARLHDGFGDIVIVANGQQRLSRNEVIAQVNNSNKLFTGSDTVGSHATVYIDDAKFYDSDGNATNTLPQWEINCDFEDSLNIEYVENSISISVDDDKLINKSFELSLCADGYEKTTLIVTIKAFI